MVLPDDSAQCQDHPEMLSYQHIRTQLVKVGSGWEAEGLQQAGSIREHGQRKEASDEDAKGAQAGALKSQVPEAQDAEGESCQER